MTAPLERENVLITGGTGAFGQAFARRALAAGASRVVIFSRAEATQAAMRAAFHDDPRLRFFIGDVRDERRVMDALRGVTVCVHAAALKRVETCEADPFEAVATNISGTANVARACIERGVQKAVFLSTDKAAAPNTLYGATKLAAERLWTRSNVYAAGTPTRFAATRYGNVFGSTGSVVPLWTKQLQAREDATITDPRMTRFLMTMADAVDLVCLALAEMQGGDVFIPKIGSAAVGDLLHAVALSVGRLGYASRVVGIRPGEKLHETLIAEDELRSACDHGSHYVLHTDCTWGGVAGDATRGGQPDLPAHGYRSDTNAQQLTVDAMLAMLGGIHPSLRFSWSSDFPKPAGSTPGPAL